GGDDQAQVWQAIEERAGKRRALAHEHHGLEGVQPLRKARHVGEVVREGLHLTLGFEDLPIRHFERDLLIVVEHRHAKHRRLLSDYSRTLYSGTARVRKAVAFRALT